MKKRCLRRGKCPFQCEHNDLTSLLPTHQCISTSDAKRTHVTHQPQAKPYHHIYEHAAQSPSRFSCHRSRDLRSIRPSLSFQCATSKMLRPIPRHQATLTLTITSTPLLLDKAHTSFSCRPIIFFLNLLLPTFALLLLHTASHFITLTLSLYFSMGVIRLEARQ